MPSLKDRSEVNATQRPGNGGTLSRVFTLERQLMIYLLNSLGDPPVRVTFWNGETVTTSKDPPVAEVCFHDRAAFLKIVLDPETYFGDSYSAGQIDVQGDLVRMLEALFSRADAPFSNKRRFTLRNRNTITGSRQNIHQHYDLGNSFYRLWLDERLAYTCAYFHDPEMSLEDAQLAKMDHVCRKLRLQPGERVIEAGCGWGSLALHMAARYGVQVRAYNISHEQIAYAREAAERTGLAGMVEFVEDDYRNIQGVCDAFVSVGMLEHVGIENYRQLGAVINQCLTPSGRGLIHTIGRHRTIPFNRWLGTQVFPGAEFPTLRDMMDVFEPFDFSVLDVENLRLHYALTLRHWLTRFERVSRQVADMFDERFVRAWRLYLAASIPAFSCGWVQLFQVVFNRFSDNNIPWTRAHLYESEGRNP